MRTRTRESTRSNTATQGNPDLSSDITDKMQQFLAHLRARKLAERTIWSREQCLLQFHRFLEHHNIDRTQDVTLEHFEQYRHELFKRGLKPGTIENYCTAVRVLFSYLADNFLIFHNPLRDLLIRRCPQSLPQVVSVEEIRRLLETPDTSKATGIRNRAILEMLYATAMRKTEATELKLSSLDLERHTVRVLGKGGRERTLPLGKHATKWLELYLAEARPSLLPPGTASENLWLTQFRRPFTTDGLYHVVKAHARKAGVAVSTHTIRRSCATHLLQNGATPAMVAELLGHQDLRTLGKYLRVTICELKNTHKQSRVAQ